MPTATHHRGRMFATAGAGAAHLALSWLAMVDLLNYTVPTTYELVDQAASSHAWMWIHLGIAILFCASMIRPYWHPWEGSQRAAAITASLGAGLMAAWAFFNLLWGLSAVRPVSLAGPVLAFVVAAGEHLLANAWTRGTAHDKAR